MQINKDQQQLIMLLIELVEANGLLSGREEEQDLAALAEFMEQIQEDRRMADTNNTERAAFESLPEFVADPMLLQRQLDQSSYIYTRVQGMWEGWKARADAAPQPNAALADGWISVDERLPAPGKPVLLDIGLKTPIRAIWAAKHTIEAGDECPDAWAEYDEAEDTYYCPEGWYEWNQYDETHWAVSRAAVAWMTLPAPPTLNASKEGSHD